MTRALLLAVLLSPASGAEGVRGRLVAGSSADLEGTVVWVEEGPTLPPLRREPAVLKMSQLRKRFVPPALALRAGDSVDFENLDSIFHNVFSLDKENRFDLGVFKGPKHFAADLRTELREGATTLRAFEKPGRFHVFCNIHPEMAGLIFAFDHGYFAASDREGLFLLPPLPPGTYTLAADGPRLPKPARTVVRVEPGTALLEVPLGSTARPRAVEHPRKDGTPYPSRRSY